MFELKELFEQIGLDFKRARREIETGMRHRETNPDGYRWSTLFLRMRRFLEDVLQAMLPFRLTPVYDDPGVLVFQTIIEDILSVPEVRITNWRNIRTALYRGDRYYPVFLEIIQGLDNMISCAKPLERVPGSDAFFEPSFSKALKEWVALSEGVVFEE